MNKSSNRMPMNSMMNSMQPQNNIGMGSSWMQNSTTRQTQQQSWQRTQQQQPVVKSLTENDISDLLS